MKIKVMKTPNIEQRRKIRRTAELWYEDGTVEQITPVNGRTFSLEEMQEAVEGRIEEMRISDTEFLVMNEEGRLIGMSANVRASITARRLVVGPVVYIPRRSLFR
jgi:hypothetical protein